MSIKRKAIRPDSWQRTRYFEFTVPMPVDEAIHALQTESPHYLDVWLQRLQLVMEQKSADLCHMSGHFDNLLIFDGYLKALPDNTTLVSGKATARIFTETMSFRAWVQSFLNVSFILSMFVIVLLSVFPIPGVSIGLDNHIFAQFVILIICFLYAVYALIFTPKLLDVFFAFPLALRHRDDLLLALQNRLGIPTEVDQ